jgi:hypothetical protein
MPLLFVAASRGRLQQIVRLAQAENMGQLTHLVLRGQALLGHFAI